MALALYNKGFLFSGKWEANIPDFFDAYPVDPSSPLLEGRNSPFPIFLIQAKLGVGPPEKIETIDVNFQFREKGDTPLQVLDVGPSEKSWIDGTIKMEEINKFSFVGNLNAKAGIANLFAKAGAELLLNKEKQKLEQVKQTRPNYVTEITSNGVGREAKWFLRQGKGIKPTGEYDLQIIFEVRDKQNDTEYNDQFMMIPKIKINGKELNKGRDHGVEVQVDNHFLPIEFHTS